ncbi:MAG: type II toxin-antitoxin system ParD family antitoxin [Thermomicrobiales bacterium]
MSVSLSPQVEARIRQRVEAGTYHSADEVINEALSLLDERDRQLLALRAKLQIGLDSGETIEYSSELMNQIEREAEEAYLRGEKPSPDVTP